MVMLNEQMMGSGDDGTSGESSSGVDKPVTSTNAREARRVSEADKDEKPTSFSSGHMVGESSKDGPNPGLLQLQPSSESRHDPLADVQPQSGGISSYEQGAQPSGQEKLTPNSGPKEVEAKEGSDTSEKKAGALSRLSSYETLEEALKGKRSPQDSVQTVPSAPLPTNDSATSGAHGTATSKDHSRANSAPPKVITTVSHVRTQSNSPSGSSTSRKQNSNLRRGKWTVEEEAYVARVIQDFNSGFLDAPAGTTLRTYLSEKLQCDPMRITKKFTGDACIGKRVFHPAVRSPSNAAAIDKAQAELEALEKRWRRRLEMQQRESAKKAAASAAAAAAATGRDGGGLASIDGGSAQTGAVEQNVVAQTASWLDRAKSVLNDPSADDSAQHFNKDLEGLPQSEIMNQMQEVQRLIHEGPVIQQSSAGIPQYLDHAEQRATAAASSPDAEPADKRLRTGAEDAEALVGFLRSVRASAANGQDF